jgi:hypothetical protein
MKIYHQNHTFYYLIYRLYTHTSYISIQTMSDSESEMLDAEVYLENHVIFLPNEERVIKESESESEEEVPASEPPPSDIDEDTLVINTLDDLVQEMQRRIKEINIPAFEPFPDETRGTFEERKLKAKEEFEQTKLDITTKYPEIQVLSKDEVFALFFMDHTPKGMVDLHWMFIYEPPQWKHGNNLSMDEVTKSTEEIFKWIESKADNLIKYFIE